MPEILVGLPIAAIDSAHCRSFQLTIKASLRIVSSPAVAREIAPLDTGAGSRPGAQRDLSSSARTRSRQSIEKNKGKGWCQMPLLTLLVLTLS